MSKQSNGELEIGVISDTHGLLRPEVSRALAGVDLIIHAGDVGDDSVLQGLRFIAPVRAVRGNMDGSEMGLASTEVVEVGGLMLYALHDLSRLDLDPRASGFSGVIYGHSHHPAMDERDGVLFLNPGSAGPRRFSLPISVARLRITASRALKADFIDLEQ